MTIASHTDPQQAVMIWSVISFDSRTYVIVISGTVTKQLYDKDILQPAMLPFILRHPGLTFQDDNARLHTAHVAMNCLTVCPILPWPTLLPDLSLIEHI